jgi:hypothetical protein
MESKLKRNKRICKVRREPIFLGVDGITSMQIWLVNGKIRYQI